MLSLYFSGTGNTKHLLETLANELGGTALSIEDTAVKDAIMATETLYFAFPTYGMNLPPIVRSFINENSALWHGKKIFVIATCGMMSGMSIGNAAGLFRKYGAEIIGGETIVMPENIGDVGIIVALLPSKGYPKKLKLADEKLQRLVSQIRKGSYPQKGVGKKTNDTSETNPQYHPKIDKTKCTDCGKCSRNCPSPGKCTGCYRCFAFCPTQAITIMGDRVRRQYSHPNFAVN